MKCQDWIESISVAELESGERRRVDEHVSACSACREELKPAAVDAGQPADGEERKNCPRRVAFVFGTLWFEPNCVASRVLAKGPGGICSGGNAVGGDPGAWVTRPVPVIQQRRR